MQNWPTPQTVEFADTVCDISRMVRVSPPVVALRAAAVSGERTKQGDSVSAKRSGAAGAPKALRIHDDESGTQIEDPFVLEFLDRRDGPAESSGISSRIWCLFGVCFCDLIVWTI